MALSNSVKVVLAAYYVLTGLYGTSSVVVYYKVKRNFRKFRDDLLYVSQNSPESPEGLKASVDLRALDYFNRRDFDLGDNSRFSRRLRDLCVIYGCWSVFPLRFAVLLLLNCLIMVFLAVRLQLKAFERTQAKKVCTWSIQFLCLAVVYVLTDGKLEEREVHVSQDGQIIYNERVQNVGALATTGVVVSSHVSITDHYYFISRFFPIFIAKKKPGSHQRIARALDAVFIDNKDLSSARVALMNFHEAYHSAQSEESSSHQSRPMLVYAEGTCTSGRDIGPLRTGAFASMLPVRPVVIKFGLVEADAASTAGRLWNKSKIFLSGGASCDILPAIWWCPYYLSCLFMEPMTVYYLNEQTSVGCGTKNPLNFAAKTRSSMRAVLKHSCGEDPLSATKDVHNVIQLKQKLMQELYAE